MLFEVSYPSTALSGAAEKPGGYRAPPSVDTTVFVDPTTELHRVIQRLGSTSWRDDLFALPHDVEPPALGLTIRHAEIFAQD